MAATFMLLNDPASGTERLIQGDHVCAIEVRRADGLVKLFLTGGHTISLTAEESKQFLHHTKAHPHRP
jgi:hypothetical protein